MQYTKPKFSVAMPGADVDWPFKQPLDGAEIEVYEPCTACGATVRIRDHRFFPAHEHSADAGRPRRRVCFGR